MGKKTYLSNQIKLMSLTASDLFTPEESALCQQIVELKTALHDRDSPPENKDELIQAKQMLQLRLDQLISSHKGVPRTVNLQAVLQPACFADGKMPKGVTWWTLKTSRKITEFSSEQSRAMGLHHNDITFDKIIVKWRSKNLLEQIVKDGFIMPLIRDDGSLVEIKYRFLTASAGQLRTDKIQCISEEMWARIKDRIECGMSWEEINGKKGINVNKYMAYTALPSSATDPWPELDLDRCIVIQDFEGPVTANVDFISPDYTITEGVRTVSIKHTDGVGMMLPCVSDVNFMVRGPWIKGLLAVFDYMRFCEEHKCEPVLEDLWGKRHNLAEENIQVIFLESQFKLWKYYDSWEHYKRCFRKAGCVFGRTNFEERYIPNTTINYQMLQTLEDFEDSELLDFTQKTWQKIANIATSTEAMLKALDADVESESPWKQALALCPELLRDAYARDSIKAIKKRWRLDAMSGRIVCENKRLFAVPDLYACCEHWFLGEANPKGILPDGTVACRPWQDREEIDVLRSPHLYMEHAVRKVSKDPIVAQWFRTDAIYTSCHDIISRILQFDCDGDQLNAVAEPLIVAIAKRNLSKYKVLPLFYDAGKADPELLSFDSMYRGLLRAHEFSGIGQVSNSLTRLWNKPNPDRSAAAWLCYYNNLVIDAAKTGKINSYENYPDVNRRIQKATGGKTGRMPWFFQYSRNGRKEDAEKKEKKKKFAQANKSVMNRLAKRFEKNTRLSFHTAGLPPFAWQMLMPSPCVPEVPEAVALFKSLDSGNAANLIECAQSKPGERQPGGVVEMTAELIENTLTEKFGSLEFVYPAVTMALFADDGLNRPGHKQMYWRVFGHIAVYTLRNNLASCHVCPSCGAKLPAWCPSHKCNTRQVGFFNCEDCGKPVIRLSPKQRRCEECQKAFARVNINMLHRKYAKRNA